MGKTILGLDLGTNSIGWALIQQDFEKKEGKILGMGSRIIPMTQDIKDEFGKGNSISQTADRTKFRSTRRLRERHLLRRERLHRVLNVLGFLPEHYANEIDFKNRLGQFFPETEPKLAYNNREFIFKKSFEEMMENFKVHQPELMNRKNRKSENSKIPYDWTIYYLRKKALTQKIEKEELAWIILNFNQKRGYYQLRGEDEEETLNKLTEFYSLKIIEVIADEKPNSKGDIWYSLHLENGWIYRRASKIPLFDWKYKIKDFIVTTELNDDGSVKKDKEGFEKRSFKAPSEEDWALIKKKTEKEIDTSEKTVGAYIYDTLLKKPDQKIKGKLIRTIERKFYKSELKAILKKQVEFQPELFTNDLYVDCTRELYKNNDAHRTTLSKRDFLHLLVDDIIFYQRPLRSQKSSISNCSLEFRTYKSKDKEGNEIERMEYLKAIPKSHPLYQEFRVWQWLYNLKIYRKEDDIDVTQEFIRDKNDLVLLFDFLMNEKEVNHKEILHFLISPSVKEKYPGVKPAILKKEISKEIAKYRWNYVFDDTKEKEDEKSKKYPCNETGHEIRKRLSKVVNISADFLTSEIECQLWHIIYSVVDKIEFEKALKSFASRHSLDITSFEENFRKFPPFKSDYGTFSEKAIKKLLPLLRLGKYWSWDAIDDKTKERIDKILTGEFDDEIKNRVREKTICLTQEIDFQGLQLWLAQYVVYDRHSEASIAGKWNSAVELEEYLKEFKQHSLRNPIVEQVITETLRVVKDIWTKYGNGVRDFFNEIHIELGREMKNTADERKRITNQINENENTNLRIKALLIELLNDNNVENVRPFSPMQQEALKIYEEYATASDETYNPNTGNFEYEPISDEILKISKAAQPSKSELQRYKLWLEQRYRSPYTGQVIPLNKLFTLEYEIEHIIPQARYFDDSFSNKVICESAVNKLKDKQLGLEFIKNHHGTIVETVHGQSVKVFDEEAYKEFVKEQYNKNRSKRNKLLLEEIPDKMIERQMNDTRYISKFISNILSNIVRADKNDDGINSKNILPGNGKITSKLKQDWGLNDIWNDLIIDRFKRMNQLTDSDVFTVWNEKYQKFLPTVPIQYSKGFSKKRIDHRHHAMDALVVACATRDHINLLNNQSAKSEMKRPHLQTKLRKRESYFNQKENQQKEKFTEFFKPWENFTVDTRSELDKIIVSFKQNLRVINKTTNKYENFIEKNGIMVKEMIGQSKGDSWAIRKPMHKDTVSGEVKLNRINVPKDKILTATRKSIDTSFNLKNIESITDTGIQKILLNYLTLEKFKIVSDKGEVSYNSELAFSPEGIEDMNQNIEQYNDGKKHQPITKARIFEMGSKFPLGQTGNKRKKFVEAAKGTNLFFAVYKDENGKRNYGTIPLNVIIERQKQGLESVPALDERENKLLFHLSPNDLVYVPSDEEKDNISHLDFSMLNKVQVKGIYKMVSSSGSQCFFIRQDIATSLVNKAEFSSLNKMEKSIDGQMIKERCIKLKIDRLGNISKA